MLYDSFWLVHIEQNGKVLIFRIIHFSNQIKPILVFSLCQFVICVFFVIIINNIQIIYIYIFWYVQNFSIALNRTYTASSKKGPFFGHVS